MRERLIELLSKEIYPREGVDPAEVVADYLLDNGVIAPPCKVGDRVWIIEEGEDAFAEPYALEVEVLNLYITKHGIAVDLKLPLGFRLNTFAVVGKTVFLTREDAEQALKGGERE